jgi:hypothetical protein
MNPDRFVEISPSYLADPEFEAGLKGKGLDSLNAVFAFSGGTNLNKSGLAAHRARISFELDSPPVTVFLKRYENPPLTVQLRNWLDSRRHISCAECDFAPSAALADDGIPTPRVIAYGRQWSGPFEKRSFVITLEIEHAASLEKQLPPPFHGPATAGNLKKQRQFICKLAEFVARFHQTGFCHRDLYLCHIFRDTSGRLFLIDLARTFKPLVFAERFRVKDIAQLFYSAPGSVFSRTDRLRFYLAYRNHTRLASPDKSFIKKVLTKARRMAQHEIRHGKKVPFAG